MKASTRMMSMRFGLALVCCAAAIGTARAQTYPSKPLRVIVPFASGGAADLSARALAGPLREVLGQPVLVDIRAGAGTIVGMLACAKSPPDGYTMCLTQADSLSLNPNVYKNLPYDAEKDFIPVIYLVRGISMLLAKGDAPFNSFKEMIAYAKSKPGVLNWGTWGPGSIPDVYLQWTRLSSGVNVAAVPYKGAGQTVPAVLAGEVDITFMSIGAVLPSIKAGKLKSLAIVGGRRTQILPDVPSLAELDGDPGLRSYFGIFLPAGTPKPIVERLNASFAKTLQEPHVQDFFRTQTLEIVGGTAEEFAAFLKEDQGNARRVFKSLGIKPSDAPG